MCAWNSFASCISAGGSQRLAQTVNLCIPWVVGFSSMCMWKRDREIWDEQEKKRTRARDSGRGIERTREQVGKRGFFSQCCTVKCFLFPPLAHTSISSFFAPKIANAFVNCGHIYITLQSDVKVIRKRNFNLSCYIYVWNNQFHSPLRSGWVATKTTRAFGIESDRWKMPHSKWRGNQINSIST